MNTLRAFIAIELDKSMHSRLAEIQAKLKAADADVKWVAQENIHLTLKFLGEVAEEKIDGIKNALDEIAAKTNSFTISLSQIGGFPNLNSPRVIWAGIEEGASVSVKIADEIELRLEKLGFPKEDRPFSAHLTLGRVRSPKNRQELKKIIEDINVGAGFKPAPTHINHITLFQSTLTPKGPIYSALHKANLKII